MSPIRQVPLVHQISDEFRQLIATGQWPVGTRIPGELQLAEELGVSRGTVREALRSLSLTGLLEPRVGDGTYVRATNEITGVLVRDAAAALTQVLDVRAGLEAAAARLAAAGGTGEDLTALAAAARARDAAHEAGDFEAYVAADAAFHRAVVTAGGNPLLIRLYDAVAEVAAASIEHTATLPEDPRIVDAHTALADAVLGRDPDAAVGAAYALIDTVKSGLLQRGSDPQATGHGTTRDDQRR
ncbi:FCD domain-containing protein [Actinoplanes sp. NPDC024001]|uniref:FadR/GntR family transcriptional regulator n=1 Tax=Actinoplanes sp. NPDC024001 TaxID=3154598 RepID=UPI0033CF3AB4